MAVKLLAYGAYMLGMILQDKAGAAANVVFFMVVYFVFTALEIGFLYRKIQPLNTRLIRRKNFFKTFFCGGIN